MGFQGINYVAMYSEGPQVCASNTIIKVSPAAHAAYTTYYALSEAVQDPIKVRVIDIIA
jgi:hypothetical protein